MPRHRRSFDELAILEMPALGGDLADVDFRVEIGGKRLAVVATVDVDDVERVDFIEMVFQRPSGENVGHAGVETGAEERGESGFLEFFLILPLPRILEFCDIQRLVVGGVHVVAARQQAGFHQIEVLVGEGDVDEELGTSFSDERGGFLGVIGIDLGGGDGPAGAQLHFGGDRVALRDGSRGEGDFPEDLGNHGAFVGDDAADPAGSDD